MSGAATLRRRADRITLLAMAAGLALLLAPGWDHAMEAGFFLTLAATIAQIVVAHLPPAGSK